MKRTIIVSAALLALSVAHATGSHHPQPNPSPAPVPLDVASTASAGAQASSSSSSSADLSASLTGSASATGGSVGPQSFEQFSRSNMYVLPAPVQAAPLPPGLCPQGDSMSIGILWNLFSYSRSSTRSEMECLDKVLGALKQQQRVEIVQAPPLPAAINAPAKAAARPAKARTRKVAGTDNGACSAAPQNSCRIGK